MDPGWLADGSAYPFMAPVLRDFVLPRCCSRVASAAGFLYMLLLLFASNYPGTHAAPWQYVGASLSHSVFACCFLAFVLGNPEEVWAWPRRKYQG